MIPLQTSQSDCSRVPPDFTDDSPDDFHAYCLTNGTRPSEMGDPDEGKQQNQQCGNKLNRRIGKDGGDIDHPIRIKETGFRVYSSIREELHEHQHVDYRDHNHGDCIDENSDIDSPAVNLKEHTPEISRVRHCIAGTEQAITVYLCISGAKKTQANPMSSARNCRRPERTSRVNPKFGPTRRLIRIGRRISCNAIVATMNPTMTWPTI